MSTYLLFGVMVSISTVGAVLNKNFQLGLRMDSEHLLFYNLLNALFASIYFGVVSGLKININFVTTLFAIVFAIIILTSLTIKVIVLSKLSLASASVIGSAGGIILPAVFGVMYFGENISLSLIFSILLMIVASVFPLFEAEMGHSSVRDVVKNLPITIVYFVLCGASVIWSKLYTSTPGVCDSNSYFFMVNVILVIGTSGFFFVHSLKSPKGKHTNVLKLFSKKQVMNIGIQTVTSNICSVLSILILSKMDISIYTIASSSLTLIAGTIVSKFYFKEYVTWKNWVSLILAIVAITINR